MSRRVASSNNVVCRRRLNPRPTIYVTRSAAELGKDVNTGPRDESCRCTCQSGSPYCQDLIFSTHSGKVDRSATSPATSIANLTPRSCQQSAIMATELTVQSERAYQKQPHIFLNHKNKTTKSRKVGKGGRRWYKDVGLGFRTPKTAIDGSYIGQLSAFYERSCFEVGSTLRKKL